MSEANVSASRLVTITPTVRKRPRRVDVSRRRWTNRPTGARRRPSGASEGCVARPGDAGAKRSQGDADLWSERPGQVHDPGDRDDETENDDEAQAADQPEQSRRPYRDRAATVCPPPRRAAGPPRCGRGETSLARPWSRYLDRWGGLKLRPDLAVSAQDLSLAIEPPEVVRLPPKGDRASVFKEGSWRTYPSIGGRQYMKWITRENANVDRIACPG